MLTNLCKVNELKNLLEWSRCTLPFGENSFCIIEHNTDMKLISPASCSFLQSPSCYLKKRLNMNITDKIKITRKNIITKRTHITSCAIRFN